MENISCILCGKPSDNIVIIENGYTGCKCDGCKLIFVSPRPEADEVVRLYSDNHAVRYADSQFQFAKVKSLSAALTISRIKRFRQKGSILELGPGGGYFLIEAQKNGYEPYGIELNPIESHWINVNLHIPCEDVVLNENSFGGKQFDIIYHRDVISHLHDPIKTFRNINLALKEDGVLVFETANIADLSESYYRFFTEFGYPDHLFFFGEKSLRILLKKSGFRALYVFKEPLFLQMLIEKALWGVKEKVKDREIINGAKSLDIGEEYIAGPSLKRRLRVLYRYISYYLVRVGMVLPKKKWPLNLVVIAEKSR